MLRVRGETPEAEENVIVESFGVLEESAPARPVTFEARFRDIGTV